MFAKAPRGGLSAIAPRQGTQPRYAGAVSQVEPDVIAESEALHDDERAWLDERLQEYEELLVYLHDH